MIARESVTEKAHRYLTEGRLTVGRVDGVSVLARCRGGDGTVYTLGRDPEQGVFCGCPARVECAHLAALRLVVDVPATDGAAVDEWAALDAAAELDMLDRQTEERSATVDTAGEAACSTAVAGPVPVEAAPATPSAAAGVSDADRLRALLAREGVKASPSAGVDELWEVAAFLAPHLVEQLRLELEEAA